MAGRSNSGEPSLGDVAYRRLRDLVLSGRLAPGDRVTERSLHELLGLGASPIRDALARLDVEGLVVTLPRRGYQISPLTLQSIDDVFDVWSILGPGMVVFAFRRLGTDGMAQLRSTIVDGGRAGDTPIDAARRAWTSIAEATANPHLIATFSRLELHLARIFYLTMEHLEHIPSPGQGDHTSVLETLLLDDEARIREQSAFFIERFREQILSVVRQLSSVKSAELSFRAS